ncbi:MAG: AMP-binding protein [Betaproteobacteria bacterium]|nr:AMP-binding protein [Betaproteobacteria bacterium]
MYSALRDPTGWTLPQVLAEHASKTPAATWITTTEGESLTFSAADRDARQVAGYLAQLGVVAGERVAVLMPNGLDFVRAWMGLGYHGATTVFLNTELRGAFLLHQINNCGASVAIVDATLLEVVEQLASELRLLKRVVVVGGNAASTGTGFECLDWSGWRNAAPHAGPLPAPQDIACVMYTSGTSGPAKGVLMPHAHCYLYGLGTIDAIALQADDCYYIVLPLFHANGLLMQLGATLIAGIRAVLRARFSASAWLADVRKHGATVSNSLGALAAFLVAQPPSPDDRNHRLRAMLNAPNFPAHEAVFHERFGVRDIISGFGMTEVNIPIWGRVGHSRPGAAGWVYDKYFDVIIANPDTDRALPPGSVGEILVRPKMPWGFMAGYLDLPDKTVEAWRNLWFHTGDAGTMTADGLVTFIDRIKDCIRRRGENISAAEVEAVVANLPGVAEVAAYAVPSDLPGGEDEVMLAIVPRDAQAFDRNAVLGQADQLLPRFARPRYLELMSELPKTATGKVQRAVLRKRGVVDAWDREGKT